MASKKLILDLTDHFTEDDGNTSDYSGLVGVYDGSKLIFDKEEGYAASDRGDSAMWDAAYFIMEQFGINGDDAQEKAMDQMHDACDSGLKTEITYDGESLHLKRLEDKREENSSHAEESEEE